MTEQTLTSPVKTPPSRWLKLLRLRIVIPAFILLALLITPFVYRSYVLSPVNIIDEPFDTKAFGTINIPVNENAKDDYELALTKLDYRSEPNDDELNEALLGDWSVASTKVRQWVKDNQKALEFWKEGTTKPHYLYYQPKDLTITSLPSVADSRTLARLASLQGKRLASEGKLTEALDWYLAMFRFGSQVSEYSGNISMLLRVTFHSLATVAILRWAENPKLTSQQLRQAKNDTIALYRLNAPISNSIKCEYFVIKNTLDSPSFLTSIGTDPTKVWLNNVTGVEPELSRRTLRHLFKNILTQIDLPLHQQKQRTVAGMRLFDNSSLRLATDQSLTYDKLGFAIQQTDYLRELASNYIQACSSIYHEKTMQGVLTVTLAAQQYQREHGKFPADAATLIKEKYLDKMPLDAMQNFKTNIQYKHTKKCTTVYGLGVDGVDDGGCSADFTGRHTGDYGYVLQGKK